MPQLVPDLIIHDGKIATLDDESSFVSAVAARDGRIIATGTDEEIRPLAGASTNVIDAAGRTVIPGIVDSHCHPDSAAARVSRWHNLEPDRVADRDALLAALKDAA